jgi:hypothetical protein
MSKNVFLRPVTQREKQVVHSLGNDNWEVLDFGPNVFRPGEVLLRKNGHQRWVKETQVSDMEVEVKP